MEGGAGEEGEAPTERRHNLWFVPGATNLH
jgi:hypothetical protein